MRKKIWIRYGFVLFIITLTAGCATTQLVQRPGALIAHPQTARIFLDRKSAFRGGGRTVSILDNGKTIGKLGPRGTLCWDREPGFFKLQVVQGGRRLSAIALEVEANKEYHLEHDYNKGTFTLISPQTTHITVTSDPLGGMIYSGRSGDALSSTGFRTPHTWALPPHKTHWRAESYQVRKNGYENSPIVFREQSVGDRKIHFVLNPDLAEQFGTKVSDTSFQEILIQEVPSAPRESSAKEKLFVTDLKAKHGVEKSLAEVPSAPRESSAKEKLFVTDLKATYGIKEGLAEALSVEVRNEIHGFGNYEVLSKEDLGTVAERTVLRQSLGCDDDQCLIDFGQIIGTKYIVAGSISKLGDTYSVNLRLINTKGADVGVKNRVSKKCRCAEDELFDATKIVAALVMGKPQIGDVVSSEYLEELSNIDRDGRFIAYDNGTVKDTQTGLMWAAKDSGTTLNWADANRYCENYRGGGYTDWRMPTQDELAGLYDKNKKNHVTKLIDITRCPWVSETRGSSAGGFSFHTGRLVWYYMSHSHTSSALPVRYGK